MNMLGLQALPEESSPATNAESEDARSVDDSYTTEASNGTNQDDEEGTFISDITNPTFLNGVVPSDEGKSSSGSGISYDVEIDDLETGMRDKRTGDM